MDGKWYAAPLGEVIAVTGSRKDGLEPSDAAQRLKKFGRNALPQGKPPSKILLFARQFNSPLMYIILVAAALSFSFD